MKDNFGAEEVKGPAMIRVATWNVNSIRQRLDHVLRFLGEWGPDILLLQETKVEDGLFPGAAFAENGYTTAFSGQKTWNGVAMISKLPLEEISEELPGGMRWPEKRILCATAAGIRIGNVYVPNGGSSGDSFASKLAFLDSLDRVLASVPADMPFLLAGDFNVAPAEDDVHDPEALDGSVCFHPEERLRVGRMLSAGAVDLFRRFHPSGKAYSWWDYRELSFQRNRGMRLDLMLASPALAARAESCEIVREARKWQKPSDHAPVLAAFESVEQSAVLVVEQTR